MPVFSFGAWYDIFLGGTLKNYARLKTEAGTDAAKHGQRLFVYVGGHAGGTEDRKIGAVDFGEKAPFDIDELTLRWYEWLLKGQASGVENERPVKIFVMGRNVDTEFTGKLVDVWPNGFAQNLTEGILRLRYRNSQEKAELANFGEIYHITVDLWATSNDFLRDTSCGWKFRVAIFRRSTGT